MSQTIFVGGIPDADREAALDTADIRARRIPGDRWLLTSMVSSPGESVRRHCRTGDQDHEQSNSR